MSLEGDTIQSTASGNRFYVFWAICNSEIKTMILSLIYKFYKHSTEKNKTLVEKKKHIKSISPTLSTEILQLLTHHVRIFVQVEVWVMRTNVQHDEPSSNYSSERSRRRKTDLPFLPALHWAFSMEGYRRPREYFKVHITQRKQKEARDTYWIEKNLPHSLLNLHGFLNNYLGKLKYEEKKSSAFPGPSICAYSYSLNGIPPFPGGQSSPSRPRALNTYLLSNFS